MSIQAKSTVCEGLFFLIRHYDSLMSALGSVSHIFEKKVLSFLVNASCFMKRWNMQINLDINAR